MESALERVRAEFEKHLEPDDHLSDAWDHDGAGSALLHFAAELLDRAEAAKAKLKP